MKKKYLPLIALAVGFVWALIAASVHSMLFALLPLLAFVFGYFSSWQRGLLNSFLLFLGYTFANALMWSPGINLLYPMPYFVAFITGGFSLCLIGTLAPLVRRGFRKPASIVALAVLTAVVIWCGFLAWTNYGYYYQVIINSRENLENLELYLPVGTVSGEPYVELFDNPLYVPGKLTENYTKELVDTEYGRMLKLTIPGLRKDDVPEPRYTGNVIFRQENPPRKLIHLIPRYDVVPVDEVSWGRAIGLVKTSESKIIEEFKVPIMVKSGTDADFELRLENRTDRGEWINFTYTKSNTYTELIRYEGSTGDEWLLVPVEVTDRLRIRGVGD